MQRSLTGWLLVFAAVLLSCTRDKTDYEALRQTTQPTSTAYAEVAHWTLGTYTVSLHALGGTLKKGYNAVHYYLTDKNGMPVAPDQQFGLTQIPVKLLPDQTFRSSPHQYELLPVPAGGFWSGFLILDDATPGWKIALTLQSGGEVWRELFPIMVHAQENANLSMTTTVAKDGRRYMLALVSPQKPVVGENPLIMALYRAPQTSAAPTVFPVEKDLAWEVPQQYVIKLDPRMPDASMGNHSSPNNQDLQHGSDGFYHGIVNYTMTGDWTLNLMLQNAQQQIIAGTPVSPQFTPGVPGSKSELHLDIRF